MAENEATGRLSWNKRHPVLSRALLYGVGALLAAVGTVLLVQRQQVDAEDRRQYLETRLEMLDLLAAQDVGRAEILKVIEDEFESGDVPPDLRQRAVRIRARVHTAEARHEEALASLDEAARLGTDDASRFALAIERADVLRSAGRLEEASAQLDALGEPPLLTLAVVATLMRVSFSSEGGGEAAALARLERVLEGIPTPAPEEPSVQIGFGLADLPATLRNATTVVTELGGGRREAALRLAAWLPADGLAQAWAARLLADAGDPALARLAWDRARALDPDAAARVGAQSPNLEVLAGGSGDDLQGPRPTSR